MMDSKACTRTKKDLIETVAKVTGQSRSSVKRTIQVAFDHIVDELAEGNRLEFRDFGVFAAKFRPGRIAQNPKTLEPVYVPPRRIVKFKPSRSMRDRLKINCEASSESETACGRADAQAPIEASSIMSEQESDFASSDDRVQTPIQVSADESIDAAAKPSVQVTTLRSVKESSASV